MAIFRGYFLPEKSIVADEWEEKIDTVAGTFLGLTVACARCHDHKFDPITQREYYQLSAYFNSIDEFGLLLSTEIVPTPSLLLPTADQEAKRTDLLAKADAAREIGRAHV